MKSNRNCWSFKHEFYPSTFSTMMIEAECGACKHLSYFVAKGFDQSANYCPYCGAKMSEEKPDEFDYDEEEIKSWAELIRAKEEVKNV